jgi:hypothetical protein
MARFAVLVPLVTLFASACETAEASLKAATRDKE